MILLQLFWNFLVIGAVSFGGGYGMISLVRETVLGHGWLTESEFLSFIAVSESTPGPLAVRGPAHPHPANVPPSAARGLLHRRQRLGVSITPTECVPDMLIFGGLGEVRPEFAYLIKI